MAGAVITTLWCLFDQQYLQLFRLLAVIVAFLIGNAGLLQVIQLANRRGSVVLSKQGNTASTSKSAATSRGPGFFGALLTQLVYPVIAVKAALMRKVQWRGITYSIGPGKKISMDSYHPYQESPGNPRGNTSL